MFSIGGEGRIVGWIGSAPGSSWFDPEWLKEQGDKPEVDNALIVNEAPLIVEGILWTSENYDGVICVVGEQDLAEQIKSHFHGSDRTEYGQWKPERRFRIVVELLPEGGGEDYE